MLGSGTTCRRCIISPAQGLFKMQLQQDSVVGQPCLIIALRTLPVQIFCRPLASLFRLLWWSKNNQLQKGAAMYMTDMPSERRTSVSSTGSNKARCPGGRCAGSCAVSSCCAGGTTSPSLCFVACAMLQLQLTFRNVTSEMTKVSTLGPRQANR